jgi:hypothetical protein
MKSTTSDMMKPTVIAVHMITCRGTVHASLGRLVLVVISRAAAPRVPFLAAWAPSTGHRLGDDGAQLLRDAPPAAHDLRTVRPICKRRDRPRMACAVQGDTP